MAEEIDTSILDRPVEEVVQRMYRSGQLRLKDIPQPVWRTLAGVCPATVCLACAWDNVLLTVISLHTQLRGTARV